MLEGVVPLEAPLDEQGGVVVLDLQARAVLAVLRGHSDAVATTSSSINSYV